MTRIWITAAMAIFPLAAGLSAGTVYPSPESGVQRDPATGLELHVFASPNPGGVMVDDADDPEPFPVQKTNMPVNAPLETADPKSVPEPGTAALCTGAVLLLSIIKRRPVRFSLRADAILGRV